MNGNKWLEVFFTEEKQALRWVHAVTILGVFRARVLLFQMNKGPSDLDQAFVKSLIGIVAIEPKVLQDIVGLVVIFRVEAFKKTRVAGMELACAGGG